MEKEVQIQRVSFKFKIDGEWYPLNKPNWGAIKKFSKDQKEAKEDPEKLSELTESFLVGLGMPVAVLDTLDPDMINDIVEKVSGQKKS